MWAQIIMGWPAILSSLLLSILGVVWRRPGLLIAGGILCSGFALYLIMWPNLIFRLVGCWLPWCHLLGAWAVGRRRTWLAWPLLFPHAAVATYLGAIVLSQ